MRLLLVEDEIAIASPLKASLERLGFALDLAEDGNTGLRKAEINDYDLIILDLNLPGIDGLEVAKRLRAGQIDTPILMLTARSALRDRIAGFDLGADDYLPKPFAIAELVARIKAVTRRKFVNYSPELTFGKFTLLADENKLHQLDGDEIELSNKECALLEYLVRNKGKIISAGELYEHTWNEEANQFSDTVRTHIKTLRQKFDPQHKILQTVRGKGYLLKS